jgi:hypothetical protein
MIGVTVFDNMKKIIDGAMIFFRFSGVFATFIIKQADISS